MSANVEQGADPSVSEVRFNDLPVEIIGYIFDFVPYPHFLDIRFVCRLWYSVATQNHYSLDHEQIVCVRDFGDLATWMQSGRYFLHLSFQGEEHNRESSSYWTDWLDKYDDQFWTRFGHRLKSLLFRMCLIDTEEFLKILSHCQQLKSLEIIDCKLYLRSTPNYNTTKNLPNLLNLERLKISYGDLIKGREYQPIRISAHEYNDPNGQLFNAIVSNAPNLKSLLLRNCMNDRRTGENVYLTSQHVLNHLQKNGKKIKEICLKADENVDKQTLVKILSIPNLKLHSLETNSPFPLALIDRLEFLESLDLDHHADEQREIEAIFYKLQNLRHIKLRCETYTVSRVFLFQNLISLDLDIDFIGYDAVDSMLMTAFCSQTNKTLKKLSLKCFCTPVAILKLAKTHPALTHLSLNCHNAVTDWSVQAIFKFLLSLETLELATCGDISHIGMTGQVVLNDLLVSEENPTGHAIDRLRNLSDLKLQYFRGTLFENGIVLPELRHLRLHRSLTPAQSIEYLIKNHPRIETLDCKCNDLTDHLVDEIIRNLPRLRYFDAGNDYQISCESRDKLRRHCKTYIQ